MSSAALDDGEDEPPVTPAKRRRAAALVPSVEKIRRSSAPRRLPAPVLLLDDEFQEHLRLHRSPRCSKCAFAMNRAAWEAVASLPRGRTWLQPQPVNAADWWVSCSVCDAADSLDNSGRRKTLRLHGASLHLGNLRQHARARTHACSCAASLGDTTTIAAPHVDKFSEALKSAGVGHQSLNKQSCRKATSLEWRLAEAIRDGHRACLRDATAIAIMLDERSNRLLLQLQACAHDLDVHSGVLGLLRGAGKTAPQIAAAVHQAVRSMCTRRALHPACNK